MPKTFDQIRRSATQKLRKNGNDSADIDVRILLTDAAGYSHSDLILHGHDIVPPSVSDRFNGYLDRRIGHEPVAYIIGKQKFWSLEFYVNKHVLIPRPETEGLVERALALILDIENPRIIDVGIGSGAVLMSLLSERQDARGMGIDISGEALKVAQKNADSLGVAKRCSFLQSNYLDKVTENYDILVSNPPYITDKSLQGLALSVKSYEPHLALSGGVDGLNAYRQIIKRAHTVLNYGGHIVFEIGYDQLNTVRDLLQEAGFTQIKLIRDLSGHGRIISAKMLKI